jgi:hypothetical protein
VLTPWLTLLSTSSIPKLRAIDEPSSSGTDSRKRVQKRHEKRTRRGLRPRVPDREFVECIRNTCGRHSTICVRSKSFPHMRDIQPCIQHPREQAHRDNQHPTSRDVTINPNAPAACSVAANTIPCPPWLPTPWLPILNPSRIPPESPPPAAASTCTSSPQSKMHISPGTLLVRSALSSRYLPSSMPALDSPKRARSCALRSTPKSPPAPSSSPAVQPSPATLLRPVS